MAALIPAGTGREARARHGGAVDADRRAAVALGGNDVAVEIVDCAAAGAAFGRGQAGGGGDRRDGRQTHGPEQTVRLQRRVPAGDFTTGRKRTNEDDYGKRQFTVAGRSGGVSVDGAAAGRHGGREQRRVERRFPWPSRWAGGAGPDNLPARPAAALAAGGWGSGLVCGATAGTAVWFGVGDQVHGRLLSPRGDDGDDGVPRHRTVRRWTPSVSKSTRTRKSNGC